MDLDDVLALDSSLWIEYDVPQEWGQGTQFPGGRSRWPRAMGRCPPCTRPCRPSLPAPMRARDVDHVRLGEVQTMALEGRVDGSRLPESLRKIASSTEARASTIPYPNSLFQ